MTAVTLPNPPGPLERPYNSGTVIYWQAELVRRLDALRPAGLTVRPNGWLVTDEASLLANSVDVTAVATARA